MKASVFLHLSKVGDSSSALFSCAVALFCLGHMNKTQLSQALFQPAVCMCEHVKSGFVSLTLVWSLMPLFHQKQQTWLVLPPKNQFAVKWFWSVAKNGVQQIDFCRTFQLRYLYNFSSRLQPSPAVYLQKQASSFTQIILDFRGKPQSQEVLGLLLDPLPASCCFKNGGSVCLCHSCWSANSAPSPWHH